MPPKRTTSFPTVAIACSYRAGGLIGGVRFVQVVPSHSHVSASPPPKPLPPKRTTLLPKVAMAAPDRQGGLVGGSRRVQVVPSHCHVSTVDRSGNAGPMTPKRMTLS